ncbi:MAG: flagellar hook-basal body complex protein [Alphaproteobacteria bacterium]
MSIFGAMFSGVSGLNANAQQMGAIADNISNVNTTGYKRTETRFKTLVTTPATATFYTPGGVASTIHNLIDRQGLLQASQSNTHLGIVGQGFFVVADVVGANNTTGTFQYSRAGEFEPDKDGNLRNTAGFFLRGWRIDSTGAITSNRSDLAATETVNVTGLTGTASATSAVTIQANLQASQAVTSAPSDVTTATVATADTLLTAATPALANNDTITVQIGTNAVQTFTFVTGTPAANQFNTLNQLASLINAASGMVASVSGTALTVTGDPGNTLTVAGTGAANLFGAASTVTATTYDPASSTLNMASNSVTPDFERSVQIFDSKGGARTLTFAYLKSQFANQWYTEVHIEPSSDVTTLNGIIASGTTAFNTDGTFDTNNTTAALTGAITVPWAPVLGVAAQTVTINFGTAGQANGLSQFDSASQLVGFDVNGALFGQLAGVTVDELGTVTAQFDNGISQDLYRLPIATFSNPNGLQPRTGNSFIQTTKSGTFNLQEAGIGTAGLVAPASIEASTVDLAEEFTDMIITQQAFAANGRVITTGDEMLDEVIRLKR